MPYFLKEKYYILRKRHSVFIFFFTLSLLSKAQVFYSTDPAYLKSKSEQNNLISSYKNAYPDTALLEISNYFPRNFMGNMGLSSPAYQLTYGTDEMGLRYFKPPTETDKFDLHDIKYFRSKGPYASLTGIAGTNRFEIFKMLFTHTYREKVNITAGFQRYTSLGFYKRQQTYTNNFYLSSNYTTKNKRMGYYLYALNNGNKSQENGGIADGVLTDSSYKINKALFKVNLANAERENRELKLMINPWFKLNSRSDSMAEINKYIQLKSGLVNRTYKYTDVLDGSETLYNNTFLDTAQSKDSSHVRTYVNDISFSVLKRNESMAMSFGYTNEYSRIWQFADTTFMNQMLHGEWIIRKKINQNDSLLSGSASLESKWTAVYIFEGINKGDLKIESANEWRSLTRRKGVLRLNALFEKRQPDYMQNNWTSNHFSWHNKNLAPVQQLQAKLAYTLKLFQMSLFTQSLNNYIYFNQEALPQQKKKGLINFGANLLLSKVFFKHLGLAINYLYQNTSDPTVYRLPQNTASAKLFYTGIGANNNLHVQFGAQLSVYDSFTAYAYMPATQVYFLQDNFKTEAYPYLDVYLNVRIRPVSFFVKVENALYGFAGPNYAMVKSYYQPDRAFRFGINWMFFD